MYVIFISKKHITLSLSGMFMKDKVNRIYIWAILQCGTALFGFCSSLSSNVLGRKQNVTVKGAWNIHIGRWCSLQAVTQSQAFWLWHILLDFLTPPSLISSVPCCSFALLCSLSPSSLPPFPLPFSKDSCQVMGPDTPEVLPLVLLSKPRVPECHC